jgi:cytochrome c-type biogenesis protein
MTALALALGTAVWLGLLTAISPCPLATNVAAIAFVSRESSSPRRAFAAAAAYTLGRSLAYVALAAVAVFAMTRLLSVSAFLQGTFYKLLGPFLILVGMALTGLISVGPGGGGGAVAAAVQRRSGGGLWTSAALGAVFALSFCPVSGALFFGGLIPLAVQHSSVLAVPAVYGAATGLPVALFAAAVVTGAGRLTAKFRALSRFEGRARVLTGIVFIVVGVYETLRGVFGLF